MAHIYRRPLGSPLLVLDWQDFRGSYIVRDYDEIILATAQEREVLEVWLDRQGYEEIVSGYFYPKD